MNRRLSAWQDYDACFPSFLGSVQQGLLDADGLIGDVKRKQTRHRCPSVVIGDQTSTELPGTRLQAMFEVQVDTVREGDTTAFAKALVAFIEQLTKAAREQFLADFDTITDATGNVLDGGGVPASPEHWLKLLEMVDMDFDENDQPIPISFVAPEEIHRKIQAEWTEEHELRAQRIIEDKFSIWNRRSATGA